jgi:hypothetical protein
MVGWFSLAALAAEKNYPKFEVYGGYQYSHLEGGINANGYNLGATGNFNSSFGITADLGSSFSTQSGVNVHNYTYTFGPQLALRAHKAWTPFVHVLFGGDHATASFAGATGAGNGMAVLAGGGVNLNFNPRLAFRGGADWMLFHSNGGTSSKNFRLPIGVVFRF